MADIGQRLEQKMLQKLSPQQIQLMKLLEIPSYALEQRIQEELESNPTLEEGGDERIDEQDKQSEEEFELDDYIEEYIEDDPTSYSNVKRQSKGLDEFDRRKMMSAESSFHDYLLEQLSLRSIQDKTQIVIAKQIIGSLDEDGYLRREELSIVDDLMFAQNLMVDIKDVEAMIDLIQKFDPPGVAARDLQECLAIQIDRDIDREWSDFDKSVKALAQVIIDEHFDAFSRKHYSKLIKTLEIEESDLKAAIDYITQFNPRPASAFSKGKHSGDNYIVPDFIVENRAEGELVLTLNSLNAPELHVNGQYQNMLSTYKEYQDSDKEMKKSDKDAMVFIRQKVDSARWFIDAIRQRQQTLYKAMYALIQLQEEYFQTGDETKIKPMKLQDIADITGLDVSTVSRVASSKYVQTEFGTKKLKEFFSEGMQNTDGEEVSTLEVKTTLQEIIAKEDKKKPLSDMKLKAALEERGFKLARRTITKYREQLNIPVARLRKEL